MPQKDPETLLRRQRFQDYCRARGWERPDGGGWLTNDAAKALGKPVNKTSDLLNGHGSFGAKIAREIEETLGLNKGLFDGVGESEDFVVVRRTDVRLSAGSGAIEEIYTEIGSLHFRRDFLAACGVTPASAKIVNVNGSSMEPTIPDGAVLLVNTASKEPFDGKVFALAKDGEGLVVKRLIKKGDFWLARSDNQDGNPDFEINARLTVTIIGRAVWMGVKL